MHFFWWGRGGIERPLLLASRIPLREEGIKVVFYKKKKSLELRLVALYIFDIKEKIIMQLFGKL